jgi:hypothetical protein
MNSSTKKERAFETSCKVQVPTGFSRGDSIVPASIIRGGPRAFNDQFWVPGMIPTLLHCETAQSITDVHET